MNSNIQKIADLTSPCGNEVVRFVWYIGHKIVIVLTVHNRQEMDIPNARISWKTFRKAGWTRTDITPFNGNGSLSAAGFRSEIEGRGM